METKPVDEVLVKMQKKHRKDNEEGRKLALYFYVPCILGGVIALIVVLIRGL